MSRTIDTKRICLTVLSIWCSMVQRLTLESSDLFAAAACIAFYLLDTENDTEVSAQKLLHILFAKCPVIYERSLTLRYRRWSFTGSMTASSLIAFWQSVFPKISETGNSDFFVLTFPKQSIWRGALWARSGVVLAVGFQNEGSGSRNDLYEGRWFYFWSHRWNPSIFGTDFQPRSSGTGGNDDLTIDTNVLISKEHMLLSINGSFQITGNPPKKNSIQLFWNRKGMYYFIISTW